MEMAIGINGYVEMIDIYAYVDWSMRVWRYILAYLLAYSCLQVPRDNVLYPRDDATVSFRTVASS